MKVYVLLELPAGSYDVNRITWRSKHDTPEDNKHTSLEGAINIGLKNSWQWGTVVKAFDEKGNVLFDVKNQAT